MFLRPFCESGSALFQHHFCQWSLLIVPSCSMPKTSAILLSKPHKNPNPPFPKTSLISTFYPLHKQWPVVHQSYDAAHCSTRASKPGSPPKVSNSLPLSYANPWPNEWPSNLHLLPSGFMSYYSFNCHSNIYNSMLSNQPCTLITITFLPEN